MSGSQGKDWEVSTLRFKDRHQIYIVNRREPHSKCMGKETSLLDWGRGQVCVRVCVGGCVCSLLVVSNSLTPWTVTYQPPLSLGVFR